MEGRVVDEEKPNKDASHRSLRISSGTRNGNVYRMLDRLKDERFVQIHWKGAVTIWRNKGKHEGLCGGSR